MADDDLYDENEDDAPDGLEEEAPEEGAESSEYESRVSEDLVRLTRTLKARQGRTRQGKDKAQKDFASAKMFEESPFEESLVGRLLIATPEMQDSNFSRAVIYLCEFSREGAMGLVINRPAPRLNFSEILRQLGIEANADSVAIRVQTGGPVGSGHGFVLHSDDYFKESTLRLPDGVALTGTMDILRAISNGAGPRKSFLALGYAGWGAGQLDAELAQNAWLTARCDEDLLFNEALETRWSGALARIGVRAGRLAPFSGRA